MYLTPFKCTVSSSISTTPQDHLNSESENHIYEVRYEGKTSKGSVTYRRIKLKGQQKPIIQDILVMEKSDMNEIIEDLISDIHKYFLTNSIFSFGFTPFNPKSIDMEVMRILDIDTVKMTHLIQKYRERFTK